MRQIILLSAIVAVAYGKAAATPQATLVAKVRSMLTTWPTPAQLTLWSTDGMNYYYTNGVNISAGETDFSTAISDYTANGVSGVLSLVESNPMLETYVTNLTSTQMSQAMTAASGMATAFGSKFLTPLMKVVGVFQKNYMPLLNQTNGVMQQMKANGRTKTDCVNQAYTMIAGFINSERVNQTLSRVKAVLTAKQWKAVRKNLDPFFLWPQYGY